MASETGPKSGAAPTAKASVRPKVAVVLTRPETVLDDVSRAMRLADYDAHLPKDVATLLAAYDL